MAIFDDIFGALTGQKKTAPYTPADIGQTLMQSAGQSAAANLAYNQAFAPGMFDLQLGLEKKYDPNIAALRGNTSQAIANELALGGSLSPEIQQLVTQNALQSAAGSGFGLSPGGRAITARDLGLTSLDLAGRRRGEAAGYVRSSPSLNSLYSPNQSINPLAVAEANLAQHEAQNQRAAEEFYNKESNKIAMYNTFGRVIGGVAAGAATGGVGTKMGMDIGGSIFQNPYQANTSNQGGMFGSILSGGGGGFGGFGSIGGPQYGIGGGGQNAGIQQLLQMVMNQNKGGGVNPSGYNSFAP